jgi:hypothetical protein
MFFLKSKEFTAACLGVLEKPGVFRAENVGLLKRAKPRGHNSSHNAYPSL